jgi:hypothetical protein
MSVTALTNDALCDAFPATVDGGVFTADNTGATADGEQGSCLNDAAVENDIWYFFTAPASGVVEIETFDTGGSDDTQIVVYSSSDGTCAGTLTEVGCNDDISGTDYMSFALVEGLTAGDTYFIQVDGWQGTQGSFDMEVRSVVGVVECPSPGAIICDNIDSYDLGVMNGQGAHWSTWSGTLGTAEDAIVTDAQAFSNTQSVLIANDGVQDVMLLTGDQITGSWDLQWKMYIPTGATGFFNIQANPTIGTAFIYQAFLNQNGGAPGVGSFQQLAETFTYPEATWFDVMINVNMTTMTHSLSIDGVDVLVAAPYVANAGSGTATTFTGIDFYSIDASCEMYVDDVVFDFGIVGLSEYTQDLFQIFPNPTEGNFTVRGTENINSVVVRNILGATVAKIQTPMSQQVNIDLSGMESGMYFVEIQVGDVINVQRVIKN